MSYTFTNNAIAKLASAITSTDTALNVVTGQGVLFPSLSGGDVFRARLKSSTALEIIEVTARSADAFTIVRAKEGTTAAGFAAGDEIRLCLTKEVSEEFFQRGEIDTDGTLAADSDTKIASQKAVKTALDLKAPLASPTFTGDPKAPTPSPGDNDTSIATTAFVAAAVAALVNAAPGALDTLKELADAINDDASFAATMTTALAAKAPLASPTFTGHVDVPTPTNSTDAATKDYVDSAVSAAAVAALDDIGDVVAPTPSTGDVLTWNGSDWVNSPATGGGGGSRATVTKTTASLGNNSVENGTVTLAKTSALLAITADRACRVVLYQTSTDRTADASRAVGVPPTPGLGVLFEAVFPTSETIRLGPVALLTNGDGTPATSIYYAITNLSGATSTVQIDFLHLALES